MRTVAFIILYLLSLTNGLLLGGLATRIFGLAKGQGLASGGIVVFNMGIGMLLGLVVAVVLTLAKTSSKILTRWNIFLLLGSVLWILILYWLNSPS